VQKEVILNINKLLQNKGEQGISSFGVLRTSKLAFGTLGNQKESMV